MKMKNTELPNHCQECGAWGTNEIHLSTCSRRKISSTAEQIVAEAMVNAGAPLMHSRVEEAVCAALRAHGLLSKGAPSDEFVSEIYPDLEGLTAAVFERSHEPPFSDDSSGVREARAFAQSLVDQYIDQRSEASAPSEEQARAIRKLDNVQAILAGAQASVTDAVRELSLTSAALTAAGVAPLQEAHGG